LAVLRYLVEHAGQVVTKAELFDALWPGTAVSDGALTFCIVALRKALGDKAKKPEFIETVHRRGYRFLPGVTTQPVQNAKINIPNSSSQPELFNGKAAPLLVGRDSDLTQLHHRLEQAVRGARQLVFVTGEAGIGKTTLINTFLQGLRHRAGGSGSPPAPSRAPSAQRRNPGVWVAVGQCIEHYGPGEPYMPILEALGRLCRTPEGQRAVTLLQHHAPTWLVQMPTLLGGADLEALQRKTAGATRERMLREMAEALDTITAERPLVLWLEDLHWSDAPTLELLALLARRQESARLLVVGTYRPVDVLVKEHPLRTVKHELQLHGLCAELPLGLLSETQVHEYLAARLAEAAPAVTKGEHGEGLSIAALRQVARFLHRRTDGNPLFLVTAVEDLVGQQVLVHREGQWALRGALGAVETRVPGSLQQLLEQHFERLSPEARRMLEVASVTGVEFSVAAVAAGLETDEEGVEDQCAELARRGQFLRATGVAEWPDGTVAARYAFLHALYQEVLYARLSAGRRQRLHQRIGERIERAYGERARELAAELAVHFERGRDARRAIHYLHQAAQNALQRSAHQEAITLLNKGLTVLTTLPDASERSRHELDLQVTLGPALMAMNGFAAPAVGVAYRRARELCQLVGETPQLFPVLWGLWGFYVVRAEYQTAQELGAQCLRLAQHVRDPALLVEAHYALGVTLAHVGEETRAQEHFEQAIALYQPHQHRSLAFHYGGFDPAVVGRAYAACWSLWLLGYPDQALAQSHEAITLAQGLCHPFSLVWALFLAAQLHEHRREGHLAHERAEAVIELAREQGFAYELALGMTMQGWALAEQGQGVEGIAQMHNGHIARQATGAIIVEPYFLALQAEAYGKVGQEEAGLNLLAEALAVADRTGERGYEAELYRLKGELTLQATAASPQSAVKEEAEACFRKAIAVAQQQHAKSLELRATMSLARLWQQQGKRQAAHQLLEELYGWFTEGFDTKDLQEAKALLDELS
jgi:predicted ATPase/DNA-binding winged helix-turn-helix (wHTH) protein